MVVFICGKCNDSLKKNKVETHLPRCKPPAISCCDCGKDFFDDSYKAHNQCISEDKKYGPQDEKTLNTPEKGGQKQQEWLNRVKEAVKEANPSGPVEMALNKLLEFDNIPRKRAKFNNFVKNCLYIHNPMVVEEVWNIFEKVNQKQPQPPSKKTKAEDEGSVKGKEESNGNHQEPSEQNGSEKKRKSEKESNKKSKKSKKAEKVKVETEESHEKAQEDDDNMGEDKNGGVNVEDDEAAQEDKEGECDVGTEENDENTHQKDSKSEAETEAEQGEIDWFKLLKREIKSKQCLTMKEFKKSLKKLQKSHKLTESKDDILEKATLKLRKRRNYEVTEKEIKYVHIV